VDFLEAVGDPELRATFSYALAQPRPVTADELAAAQGIHRNVARSRLERLVAAGLLATRYERRTGRTGPGAGRPAKTYTVESQQRPIEFPARRYETLLGLVLDALPSGVRKQRLRAIGSRFADELLHAARPRPVKTLAAAAERVCEVVRAAGFHAAVSKVGDRTAVIETATCPLRPLVRERQVAAELDRAMWSRLAAHALKGVEPERIECETCRCGGDGPCLVRLTLDSAAPDQRDEFAAALGSCLQIDFERRREHA
jgi:predicted ArsR family transcriptional regulator